MASPSRAPGTTLWRGAGRDSEKEGGVLGQPVSWTPRYCPTLQAAEPAACSLRLPPRDSAARHSPELRRGTSHRVRPAVPLRSLTHASTLWEGGHQPRHSPLTVGTFLPLSATSMEGLRSSQHPLLRHRLGRNQQTRWAAGGLDTRPCSCLSQLFPQPQRVQHPASRTAARRRGVTEPAAGHRPHIPQTTQQHSSRPPPAPDLRAHRPAVLPDGPHVGTDQRTRPRPQTKDWAPLHPPVWSCPKPQMAAENKAHFRPLGVLVFF